jgi:hypothetical protein
MSVVGTLTALAAADSLRESGCLSGMLRDSAENPEFESAFEPVSPDDQARVWKKVDALDRGLGLDLSPIVEVTPFGGIQARASCDGLAAIQVGADLLGTLEGTTPRALDVVLAHELGHLLEYRASVDLVERVCANRPGPVKALELLADLVAGYAMHELFKVENANDLVVVIAELADYQFNDDEHHGTVAERMNAFNLGQMLAFSGRELAVDRFMKNQEAFLETLSGPRANGNSAAEIKRFYEEAMEGLYR